MEHRCFTFQSRKTLQERHMVSQWKQSCFFFYQSFLIVGVCYGGKAVVGSVGNMLASSVTRLSSWLVMEGMSQCSTARAGFDRTLDRLFHLNVF